MLNLFVDLCSLFAFCRLHLFCRTSHIIVYYNMSALTASDVTRCLIAIDNAICDVLTSGNLEEVMETQKGEIVSTLS